MSTLSFSATDLGNLPENDGNFSFTWDDLYVDKSGSPRSTFGGDLLRISLGADYKVKGGLLAKIQGDLGNANVDYTIDIGDFVPITSAYGVSTIDSSAWVVTAGSLDVASFDPSDFRISVDLSADIELSLNGSISSHLKLHKDAEYLKTKNPLYSPNQWIEETIKTLNPLYHPNQWIVIDIPFTSNDFKTKDPLYNPTEWLEATIKTKNPFYNPNEWIYTQITPEVNINEEIIPQQTFSTGNLIDLSASANLFKFDAGQIEPYSYNFEYGSITAQVPNQVLASTDELVSMPGRLPSLVAFGSTPVMTASVDILKLITSAFGVPPQVLSGNKSFGIGKNIDFAVDYSLMEVLASANVSIGQRSTFVPNQVSVTMQASTGETVTGKLGEKFDFGTPTEGSGEITVTAMYTLDGALQTDTGLLLDGSLDLKGLAFGVKADLVANILGIQVDEHWDKDLLGPLIDEKLSFDGSTNLITLDSQTVAYTLPSVQQTHTITYDNLTDDTIYLDFSSAPLAKAIGGSGIDTLALQGATSGQVIINLSEADQIVAVGGVGETSIQSGFEIVRAFDLQGASVDLSGDSGNNVLYGTYASGDLIRGGAGDDEIISWQGADTLSGDAGADTFVFFKGFSSGSTVVDFRMNGEADRFNFSNYGANPVVTYADGTLTITAADGTQDTIRLLNVLGIDVSDYFFT